MGTVAKRTRIAIVLGTRPEIIKLAPVIQALGSDAYVIHTGQHYDSELSGQLFLQLGLAGPDVVLGGIGGSSRWEQISSAIASIATELLASAPDVVVVQGDTNTVSAGAQAASYLGIPVVHIEAGLRSNDRRMPEELNRLVAGALADVHCAATSSNAERLMREGVTADRVFVTGNTIVEATLRSLAEGAKLPEDLAIEKFERSGFVLATIHRPENTDTEPALRRVLTELGEITQGNTRLPVVFVAHPRVRAAIERFELSPLIAGMTVLRSVDHQQFLALAQRATILVSDSGGVQEEVTVLKRPLVVPRRSTERPESVSAGFSRLAPPETSISELANEMLADPQLLERLKTTPSPYGDGTATEQITAICLRIAAGELLTTRS